MLPTRRLVAPLLTLALLAPSQVRAHIAEFEAVLDVAQEVPAPVGTNPTAGGSGTFFLEDDGTVEAEVTYHGLTGAPGAAHIHQGAPGVPGGVITNFSALLTGLGPDGTISGVGGDPLSAEEQATML